MQTNKGLHGTEGNAAAMKTDHYVTQAVQTFREAQNLLPNLYTHVSALENIMIQKATLKGALRRHNNCFAKVSHPSFALWSEDEGAPATVGLSCSRTTSQVLTSPLGVLGACSPSTVHHLIAQHQRDEAELLIVISRITQQQWPQKIEHLKKLIKSVEQDSHSSTGSASSPLPSSSVASVAPKRCSSSFFASLSELDAALFGFAACLVKLGSILQEMTLALRKDVGLSLVVPDSPPAAAAAAPSIPLASLEPAQHLTKFIAREGQQRGAVSLLPMQTCGRASKFEGKEYGHATCSSADTARQQQPLHLIEAVGQLKALLEARWERCCEDLLPEDSHMLLTIL